MNYLGRIISSAKRYYSEINSANLSGAIDVIVVEHEDGEYTSSPFYVQFGKMGVFRPLEKVVEITINGTNVDGLVMRLTQFGHAYFDVGSSNVFASKNGVGLREHLSSDSLHSDRCPDTCPINADPVPNYDDDDLLFPTDDDDHVAVDVPLSLDNSTVPRVNALPITHRRQAPSTSFSDQSVEESQEKYALEFTLSNFERDLDWYMTESEYPERVQLFTFRSLHVSAFGAPTSTPKDITRPELNDAAVTGTWLTIEQFKNQKNIFQDKQGLWVNIAGVWMSLQNAALKFHILRIHDEHLPEEIDRKALKADREDPEFHRLPPTQTDDLETQLERNIEGHMGVTSWLMSYFSRSNSKRSSHTSEDEILSAPVDVPRSSIEGMINPHDHLTVADQYTDAVAVRGTFAKSMDEAQFSRMLDCHRSDKDTSGVVRTPSSVVSTSSPHEVDYFSDSCEPTANEASGATVDSESQKIWEGRHPTRTVQLTSDEIRKLNLQYGMNTATFSIISKFQGTCCCECSIFLWKSTDKVVVSDIDGTITRSDIGGHLAPLIGFDWIQVGIAKLYIDLIKNGYRIIYVSARAIGQARTTRHLLQTICQGGRRLPEGPIILSPNSLIKTLQKELVQRRPEELKIANIQGVRKLFFGKDENAVNAFVAGFGNRQSDVATYESVQIPSDRIFIVNYKSEVRSTALAVWRSSYDELNQIIDTYFPPVGTGFDEYRSQYTDVTFWRDELPPFNPDASC